MTTQTQTPGQTVSTLRERAHTGESGMSPNVRQTTYDLMCQVLRGVPRDNPGRGVCTSPRLHAVLSAAWQTVAG